MTIVRKHKRRTNKGLTRVKQHKRKVKKRSEWPVDSWEQSKQLDQSVKFFRENPINDFVLTQMIVDKQRLKPKGKITKQKIATEVTKLLSDKDKKYIEKQQELARMRSYNLKKIGWNDNQIRNYIGKEIRLDPYFRIFRGRRKQAREELKSEGKLQW